jgi:hypothetical protein
MRFSTKILSLIFLIVILVITKLVLFDYPISQGKRVGNLTKLSLKGQVFKTWEGTIDEGSGDQLTSEFSVRDSGIAQELYEYEGRRVVIHYEQYYIGWPRDTNYNVTAWRKFEEGVTNVSLDQQSKNIGAEVNKTLLQEVQKGLFCNLLGILVKNPTLYKEVKSYVGERSLYLFNQFKICNESLSEEDLLAPNNKEVQVDPNGSPAPAEQNSKKN